jgi:hypothetical protein
VAGGAVYAQRGRAPRITRGDRISEPVDGVTPRDLIAAAGYFAEWYEAPIHGTQSAHPGITCAGLLNLPDLQQLLTDDNGVTVVRTALERHLDFFDSETSDGRITIGENWRGWRRLGYGYLRSLIGTLGAAMAFGRIRHRFAIDIARINEKRKERRTGLYDANGQVNEGLLAQYLEEFDGKSSNGTITHEEALEIIERRGNPGWVSKRQFKSLFGLCARLNRNQKLITKDQFKRLFDGSLLYLAASIPNEHGRRGLLYRPASAPLLVKLAVLLMAVLFAPWFSEDVGTWRHISGWLIVAASWVLYAILHARTAVERSLVLIIGVLAAASVWTSLSWAEALTVWPFILLTAGVAIGQQWRPVLQYMFYARFPLLIALATMVLPVVGIWGAPLLFKSLFVLEWGGVMFVVLLAMLVGEVCVATARLIARNAHKRFTVTQWRAPADVINRRRRWLVLVIALPLILSLVWFSELPHWASAVGAAAGIALGLLIQRLAQRLGKRQTKTGMRLRRAVEKTLTARLANTNGYLDATGDLLPGHLGNAGLFAITLLLYALGFVVLWPTSEVPAPALAFVLFILIMLGWFLPAVSFFADKYRLSTVLVLAVIPFVLSFINDIDHYYETMPMQEASASPQQELRRAFDARLQHATTLYPGQEPVIIAVAAGGGGGSAALWSARVLAGLQRQFGPRFTDSIQLVSAVSGGSLGTVYFLDAFDGDTGKPGATPSDDRLDQVVTTAGRSTLAPVAWGLAYPDFWRFFSVRYPNPYVDRGWALEEAVNARLGIPDRQLSQWRDGIIAGWRPAVLFNATVSETGERLVISPLRLQPVTRACKEPDAVTDTACEDQIDAAILSGTYKSNPDLRVATAARLSATFPFVFPIPRPRNTGQGERAYHIADGGYYDNDGLLTLVEWAQKAIVFAGGSSVRKILLIDIRVIDPPLKTQPRAGWIYSTVGPLLTMLTARTSSQGQRNEVDVKLLSGLRQMGDIRIEHVSFPMTLLTSRSWHLPTSERTAIQQYWDTDRVVLESRRKMCAFLGQTEWNCAPNSP